MTFIEIVAWGVFLVILIANGVWLGAAVVEAWRERHYPIEWSFVGPFDDHFLSVYERLPLYDWSARGDFE